MNTNSRSPASFDSRLDEIHARFEDDGGFADLTAVQTAHQDMLRLAQESEAAGNAEAWAQHRNSLAFWCALCISLEESPPALVRILSGLPQRQNGWGAQMSVSLFRFQAHLENANRSDLGYIAIPIDALEEVRQALFHVFWTLWAAKRIEVFQEGHLPIPQALLTGRPKTEEGTILSPGSWVPPILKKLVLFGVAEAEYLQALIEPSDCFSIDKPDDPGFILTSYSLGYRWRTAHPETAKDHFDSASGFNFLYDDDEDHKHASEYLDSFRGVFPLLNSEEVGSERIEDPPGIVPLPYPYMDFLWTIIDDSRNCADDIENELQQQASEKKSESEPVDSFTKSEASVESAARKHLISNNLCTHLISETGLGNQVLRVTRCAQRIEATDASALHEELISALYLECGRLIEAYFKWCLRNSKHIQIVPFDEVDLQLQLEGRLRTILNLQNVQLGGLAPLEYSFGRPPIDGEIRNIQRLLKNMRMKANPFENRDTYRTLLGANLWISAHDYAHPWRQNETLRRMNLPKIAKWYKKRNEHAHFSPEKQSRIEDERNESLNKSSEIIVWLDTLTRTPED